MRNPPQLNHRYTETNNGILVPPGYRRPGDELARRQADLRTKTFSKACDDGFAYGLRLERDPDTLVVRWAEKGSGLDDLVNQSLADGTIANVGISPVLFAQLTGLIRRRQNQVLGASIVITGRSTSAKLISNAIARWNDAPLGAVDGLRKIVYQLDTYNRGAPVATVPIWLPTEDWEGERLYLHEFENKGKGTGNYWLEVNWNVHKRPVPYLPSVFDLEPTGVAEWPYWFKKAIDGVPRWILLHRTQIVSLISGYSGQPGIGTSAVYTCLGFLGEHALAIDERYEAMIDSPGEGIVTISGVTQGAQEIRNKIEAENTGGAHDWTLLASPNDIKVDMQRWRTNDQVDFTDRQAHFEDVLALAFDEPLSSVVMRGGIGYGAQAETGSNNVAEGGVFAIMKALELVLGTIYPRVTISVTKANDRARKLSLELLDTFATAIAKLPEGTLTVAETRAYIDRELITIPIVTPDTAQDDARAGTDDDDDSATQADKLDAAATIGGNDPAPHMIESFSSRYNIC